MSQHIPVSCFTMPSRRPARGFTLIELIVVIVILGILAATALPKFMDMRAEANRAALAGIEASVKSAMNMAHAKCRMISACTDTGSSVDIVVDGATRRFFKRFPDGGNSLGTGIEAWVVVTGDITTVQPNVTTTRWQVNSAPTPANCYLQYVEASVAVDTPQITSVTTGC